MDTKTWKSFDCINKFVGDLTDVFGTKQHSLLLYNRLLGKTNVKHMDAIKKHVQSFTDFVTKNRQAIMSKDREKFSDPIIFYSKKVNIKMDEIFKMADSETTNVIWQHLLVITNSVDPSEEAMEILKKSLEEKSNEGAFLSNLVQKIEKNVDPNSSDPMAAIMGLMSSGVFTDLISNMNSGMQDGSLNIGKLFGTVQGMMSSMQDIPGMGTIPGMPGMGAVVDSNSVSVSSSDSSVGSNSLIPIESSDVMGSSSLSVRESKED